MKIGSAVTTRHFGGYERVDVVQVHETYYVVSRFGGQVTDILPRNKVEKTLRDGPASEATSRVETQQGADDAN